MSEEVKYVAGFLFNGVRSAVALIHKTHGHACMVGKWNAIGGKIKRGEPGLPDESSAAAMWRLFQEEAGVSVNGWTLFLKLKGVDWSVDFFHAFSNDALAQVRTCEGETVEVFHLNALPETVPNLRWILPMALCHEDDHVWVYEVTEKEIFAPRAAKPLRKAVDDRVPVWNIEGTILGQRFKEHLAKSAGKSAGKSQEPEGNSSDSAGRFI